MNRADVQGLLFSSYAEHAASALILLRFADGRPNAWLRRVLSQVSSAAGGERHDTFRLNLAFTYRGLEKLHLPAATLAGFSPEFRQGMAHPQRLAALGDRAPGDPAQWDFADGESGVDGVALVYAPSAERLEPKLAELEQGTRHFGLEAELLRTHLPDDAREHFGFRMGASEPNVRGIGRRRSAGPRIALGEFLLGYRDGVGDRTLGPNAPARRTTRIPPAAVNGLREVNFGLNGSYVVLRKLEQRVEAFRAFLDAVEARGRSRELCVGQNSRASLTADEQERARHRLLQRDRLYGGSAAAEGQEASERGLLFLALNADLGRQFEHVQRLTGLSPWVRVRGGLYGFLPSLGALGYLADLAPSPAVP